MNKELEQKLLNGEIRLVDCNLEDTLYLYDKYFFNFNHDFFYNDTIGYYTAMDIKSKSAYELRIFDKGIITQDGAIYPVYDLDRSKSKWLEENGINNHVISSAWLRLNGIDLTNAVRFVVYEKGLEFYPCHECFGKLDNIKDIDTLIKTYVEKYEKSIESDRVIALTPSQIRTMEKVATHFSQNLAQAMTKTDCFGLTKKPSQFEDARDSKNCKYNRLYFKECLDLDENDMFYIQNREF